jgi:hypothetical protein
MKSQYMQIKLFLAAIELSDVQGRIRKVSRRSAEFRELIKRNDDLSEEIQSIYLKTEVGHDARH